MNEDVKSNRLTKTMSLPQVWALALGTSIGWGSLVVTSHSYLLQAGPWGSIIGLLVGCAIMLVIARNYHYMISCYPDAGGAYTYARQVFGYDHGFLTAWFLGLVYIAILWANATSIPLFARFFLGDLFQIGFHYHVFGYEVFLGEALLSVAAVFLVAWLCAKNKSLAMNILLGLAVVFTLGIVVAFAAGMAGHAGSGHLFDPGFLPNHSVFNQVILIACISPWAFVGFENISNVAEEYSFSHTRSFRILTSAVITATALYIFLILLSVSAYPDRYGSWLEYLRDLDHLEGYEAIPAFYAAYHYLGGHGIRILLIALFGLIVTSLIGNITALSRLLYALGRDSILPRFFSLVNHQGAPGNAILLVALLSVPVPFLGRTGLSWIVDVTTIGATIIYAFVSTAAMKTAGVRGDRTELWTGRAGLILMIAFGADLLIPNLVSTGSMATESYLLFTLWGVLGFLVFHLILKRDTERVFGKSTIVWTGLLSLVLIIALIWMNQTMIRDRDNALEAIEQFYITRGDVPGGSGVVLPFIEEQFLVMQRSDVITIVVVAALFSFSLVVMMANYSFMRRRADESEQQLHRQKELANRDPLTGVKSKRAFADGVQEIDAMISDELIDAFAVVVCDINELKMINDTRGHRVGDDYIKAACQMICRTYQHSPVYRIGGDEFVAFLTGRDYRRRKELLAALNHKAEDNLKRRKEEEPAASEQSSDEHLLRHRVIVSAGMSEFDPDRDQNFHAVFERADAQMYARKKDLKKLGAKTR